MASTLSIPKLSSYSSLDSRELASLQRKALTAARAIGAGLKIKHRRKLAGLKGGPNLDRFSPLLRDAMLASHLQAMVNRRKRLADHIEAKELSLSIFSKTVEFLRKKLDLSGDTLDALEDHYDTQALKVVHAVSDAVDQKVQQKVSDLIESGAHVKEGVEELDNLWDDMGLNPQKDYQLETIFRTQMRQAYGAGTWNADQDEAVQEILWGYTYSGVMDDREREEHVRLEGVTLPKDHEFWQGAWPPNGWNCRCDVIPLFGEQEIVDPPDDWEDCVDDGFGYNPGAMLDGLFGDDDDDDDDEDEFSFSYNDNDHPRGENGRWISKNQYLYDDGAPDFEVRVNPSKDEVRQMIVEERKKAFARGDTTDPHNLELRFMYDPKQGNMHVWSAHDAIHAHVADQISGKDSSRSWAMMQMRGEIGLDKKGNIELVPYNAETRVNQGYNKAAKKIADDISWSFDPDQPRDDHGRFATTGASKVPQTETAEFKKWFKDSKVVDEDGKPLVVYHGTHEHFTVPDAAKTKGKYGPGFYFGADRESVGQWAQFQARRKGQEQTDYGYVGTQMMPVFVSLKNPLVVHNDVNKLTSEEENLFRGLPEGKTPTDFGAVIGDRIRKAGYDGIILKSRNKISEVIAFEPQQVKSATGNRGTFDPSSADIRMSHDEYTVVYVNGFSIRNRSAEYQEFGGSATHVEHSFIPDGEIWIEDDCEPQEIATLIAGRTQELRTGDYDKGLALEKQLREDLYSPELFNGHFFQIRDPSSNSILSVREVSGLAVRNRFKTDFIEGGNGYEDSFIPKNEIWIEARLHSSEKSLVLLHELTELRLMRDQNLVYEKAHEKASAAEWFARSCLNRQ